MAVRAVVFDLGGVVMESPIHFLADFERTFGVAPNLIARLVGGYGAADGHWQRLERGEVPISEFCRSFDEELARAGAAVSTEAMMQKMAAEVRVREPMLDAIRRLRAEGLTVAALTNNWKMSDDHDTLMKPLREEFDLFIESCKVGMRKPERRIYELLLDRLGIPAERTVFLDDIGGNLKAARALGIATIKVVTPEAALSELERVLGISLARGAAGHP